MKQTEGRSVLRWLNAVLRGSRGYLPVLTLAQMLHGFSGVVYALLLRRIVDSAANGQREGFLKSAVLFALVLAAQLLLRVAIRRVSELAYSRYENLFKRRLLRSLLTKDYGAVTTVHSGEWMNRLTGDTAVVAGAVTAILPGVGGMLVKLLAAFVVILRIDRRFGLCLLPFGCAFAGFICLFRTKLKRLHRDIREKDGALRTYLQEQLSTPVMLRALGMEARVQQEADERMQAHRGARLRSNRFANLYHLVYSIGMNGLYAAAVIWCGAGILHGRISYGTLAAMMQLVGQVQTPISNLSGYVPRYFAMTASAGRLMEAEALPETAAGEKKTEAETRQFYETRFTGLQARRLRFAYPRDDGEAETLRGVSFSVRKGDIVALCGPSGCGKSTLFRLLMGLYQPDEGELLLKTDGGAEALTGAWIRLFSYVPQENLLMAGSVRDAVSFGEKEPDEARLRDALDAACAMEFVDALPKGMDTRLNEKGAGLSEGQLQRLAIARAVYAGHPILLLDEATSALDEATEQRLLRKLRELPGRTVLIVTHRPAVLQICNSVLAFGGGRVETVGRDENGAFRLPASL